MNNRTLGYSRSLYSGLWLLLLSASITNLINVLSLLLFGNIIPILGAVVKYVTIAASALMIIRIARSHFLFITGSLVLFALIWYKSYTFNSAASSAIEENVIPFFCETLPYLWIFYGFCKSDIKKGTSNFFYLLYRICKVKLVLALLAQLIMFVFPSTDIFHDYMNAANAILLGLNVVTIKNIINKHSNKLDTILEAISVIFILLLGSRGGILCYASVYLLYYIFVSKARERRRIIGLILVGGVFLFLFGPSLLSAFMGSSSRYTDLLSSGNLFYDEERALISTIIFSNIIDNPFGLGVMADRPILTESTEVWAVFYTHNLELEMALNFGYIGFLISAVLICFIIYILRKNIQIANKQILVALVATSIIKLQVSSSYWIDPIFWAVVGYVLACRKMPNLTSN